MFSIRSWTDSDPELPYRAACECKAEERFGTERERWLWIQNHRCTQPLTVLYLDAKRKARADAQ